MADHAVGASFPGELATVVQEKFVARHCVVHLHAGCGVALRRAGPSDHSTVAVSVRARRSHLDGITSLNVGRDSWLIANRSWRPHNGAVVEARRRGNALVLGCRGVVGSRAGVGARQRGKFHEVAAQVTACHRAGLGDQLDGVATQGNERHS